MPYRIFRSRARRTLGGAVLLAGAMALAACGGGSSSGGSGTGSLTLGITDGPPVVDALEVNVVFTGVTLKPENGQAVHFDCGDPGFDCDPTTAPDDGTRRTINLLSLTGDESETLLDGITLNAGRYEWIRLQVDAATPVPSSTGESNVVLKSNPQGSEPLLIPSGEQSGLKLVSGFHVPDGGAAAFTIDFVLRKGLVRTGDGKLMLRPAHRLIDNSKDGSLAGEVAPTFLVVDGLPVSDGNCVAPAAYVYSAIGFTEAGQIGSTNEPSATADLQAPVSPSINYTYEVGFLDPGDYKVAIACAGDDDEDPDDVVPISTPKDAVITTGEEEVVNFF